ncbi:MAG: MarR family winged helix-turn-helix transcriptional regulator [Nitrosopumilaceae archaeon]|jgi:MarR family transcriptional regulator for hemolysin
MRNYDHEKSIGFIVNNTTKMFQKIFDYELNKDVGLGLAQSKVIYALSLKPGMTQKELADKVGIETPTLVVMIDKMEKEHLVKRQNDKQDRRIKRISITSKADRLVDSMIQSALSIKKIATKNISESEVKRTLENLNKISQNLQNYWDSVYKKRIDVKK